MTMHIAPETLTGYLDGELTGDQLQAVETHLARCADCKAGYEIMVQMQRRIRSEVSRHSAPAFLRGRIIGEIRGSARRPPAARPRLTIPWWGAAAAMAFTAVLSVALTITLAQPGSVAALDEEIAASHVRSLIGDRSTDVASSDQHTVKPWFNGKLEFSPPVKDLVAEGFPLLGGRVDYVGKRRVAVLVYRRRQHLIDVYVWPAEERAALGPNTRSIDGYHIERGAGAGMVFVAISDVNRDDLRQLIALLRQLPG